MSLAYKAVGWNRQKKIYDLTLWAGIFLYLLAFTVLSVVLKPQVLNNVEMVILRAVGTAAFVLLHVILSIGPLCRLDRRFLPLLYNRRHMGVSMFLLALVHGLLALMIYHGGGNANPLTSMLTANLNVTSIAQFPFQPLGFLALLILFLMAATSHDFWLANLTPPVWKALHMLVYVAYALLVAHVSLGFLQAETSPVITGITGLGLVWICALHIFSAGREKKLDTEMPAPGEYVDVCAVDEIAEKRGKIIVLSGDRVAVFKYDGKISAVSNACQHQNGPLGEGRIIDGFITCPWHGFQYEPDTGASPPPFTEKIPTFNVKVINGRIWVCAEPNPPGTRVEPARIDETATEGATHE